MSLQEFIEKQKSVVERRNTTEVWLETLTTLDREAAILSLQDSSIPSSVLFRAFKDFGAPVSEKSVRDYRRNL